MRKFTYCKFQLFGFLSIFCKKNLTFFQFKTVSCHNSRHSFSLWLRFMRIWVQATYLKSRYLEKNNWKNYWAPSFHCNTLSTNIPWSPASKFFFCTAFSITPTSFSNKICKKTYFLCNIWFIALEISSENHIWDICEIISNKQTKKTEA